MGDPPGPACGAKQSLGETRKSDHHDAGIHLKTAVQEGSTAFLDDSGNL
jgi:hypothetical protein